MKRSEFWNHLLNSGKNAGRPAKRKGISVFVGTAFIAIIAITALLLIACSGATSEDPVEYTVTFDSNSGSSVTSQQVAQGAYAAEPEVPTRSGYVFDGWFSDSGLSTAWTFASDAVNSDITLYAKWVIAYTVTFDSDSGSSVTSQQVAQGAYAAEPEAPTKSGYVFDGWFSDSGLSTAWTFASDAVNSDITLYAKWVIAYTVTFDSNSGSSVTSQQVVQGAYAAEPTVPTRSGYVFDGWFSDSGLSTAWTFASDAVNSDITLYAKWGIPTILVQGGTFDMGSADSDADPDESPVRSVTVNSFYMAETELTFEQYDAYCEDQGITKPDDEGFGRGTRPVINVSWYDAVKYSNWLSEQAGLTKAYTISGISVTWDDTATGYRLPTEAEWEYAARGGDQSQGYKYSGSDTVDEVGWHSANSGSQTQPVGQKQANELGLYDMSGNVWEWSWDWYGAYSSASQTDPIGPTTGSFRVFRGGGWNDLAGSSRPAYRNSSIPGHSYNKLGFRLVWPAD